MLGGSLAAEGMMPMTEKPRRDEPRASLPRSGDPGVNLDNALKSILTVQSTIPEDAFTAETLGEQRSGSGVVIRESGLVLTIGYLITEAENVWLADARGRVTPAHALAIDPESGFGLVQALDRLDSPALELGRSSEAKLGDPVVVASGGGVKPIRAMIVGKQEFAGYWEYLLDEAIFTRGGPRDINMVVPIDLLPPILDDLLAYGRVNKPARPWLGIYSAENGDEIIVASVSDNGPAAEAGLRRGDVLAGVGGSEVESLADFYRKIWSCGPAGVEIPIEIVRDGRAIGLRIQSADRSSFLKRPRLQ
jgi:S1-C subfamily serine protease